MSGHLVLADAAPDNGMRHNRVGADEDQRIGQFQILQGIAGRIVAKSLLVADSCGRHAKTCITVYIGLQIISHDMTKDRELLQRKLPCTDARNALCAILGLDFLDLVCDMLESFVP